MINIVILCPLGLEYMAVRAFLTQLTVKKLKQSNLTYEAGCLEIGKTIVSIAIFETGKYIENVNLKTFQILSELQPDFAFLVGVAGGIKDVEIGDVVIGTLAYCYEHGKVEKTGFISSPTVKEFSQFLIEQAKQLDREYEMSNYKRVFGAINSGNKVLKDIDAPELKIIKTNYGNTTAVEMESYGFAKAASEFSNTDFINIRGISDLIKDKEVADESGTQELAAQRAAKFTFDLIEKLSSSSRITPVEEIEINCLVSVRGVRTYVRRGSDSAMMLISHNTFLLKSKDKRVSSLEIEKLEHVKMPGDFSKNSVCLKLANGEQYFISQKQFFPGFYNIFGGNKQLCERMKKCIHI